MQHDPTDDSPDPRRRFRLDPINLRLAMLDILSEPRREDRTLACAMERLWREDPDEIAELYDTLMLDPEGEGDAFAREGRHGRLAARMRELRRPIPCVRRHGLTVAELGERLALSRETTARLLEHHGLIDQCPFGRNQNRRLVSERARQAGLGHNVVPQSKSVRIDGANRAAPFPVFYPERLDDISWLFDWDSVVETCRGLAKREALHFLLSEHSHLPDDEVARLSGYARESVTRARRRPARPQTSHASYREHPDGEDYALAD